MSNPVVFTSIELARALATTDGDRDLLGVLAGMLPEQIEVRRAEIERTIASGDYAALAESAHALKGALLAVAATRASSLASELERAARHRTPDSPPPDASTLLEELDRLLPELDGLERMMGEAA